MWPKTIIELIGFFGVIAGLVIAIIKICQMIVETSAEKLKIKSEKEIAEIKASALSAAQVSEILKNYYDLKEKVKDLETNHKQYDKNNEKINEMIENIHESVETLQGSITKYLMDRTIALEDRLKK